MGRIIHILAISILLAAATTAAGDETTYTVLIEHRAVNLGRTSITKGRIVAELPRTNRYQQVKDVRFYPEPSERRLQSDGSTHLEYRFGYLPASATYVVRILAVVTPRTPVSVDLARPGKPKPLDLGGIPALHPYLKDHVLCDMDSAAVQDEAARLGALATKDGQLDRLAYAKSCYNFLTEKIRYDRDDRFDPAGKVLRRRRGSCTELTFTFLALCRIQGIPARVVGGFVSRSPGKPTIDSITHRWAEFHDPRFGWIPVDPSRGGGRGAMDRLRYFGHVNTPGLLFIQTGSGSTALSFRSSSIHYRGKARIRLRRTAYWHPKPLTDAELAEFEQRFAKLRHHTTAVRHGVLRRLEGTASTLDCAVLAQGLMDRSRENRAFAAKMLATAKTPHAVFVLLRALQVVVDKKRRAEILDAVRLMVTGGNGVPRRDVISLLGRSRRPEAADVLAELADHRDPALRRRIGVALVRCRRHKSAAAAIEKLLADKDDSVRLAVAVRLGYAKVPRSYPILLAFLSHTDFAPRIRAVEALRHAAGKHLGYDPLDKPKANAEAIAAWKAWATGAPGS